MVKGFCVMEKPPVESSRTGVISAFSGFSMSVSHEISTVSASTRRDSFTCSLIVSHRNSETGIRLDTNRFARIETV